MEQRIVRTSLFGVNLTLKVDTDEEHLARVVEFLERKGQEVSQKMIEADPHRISVIVNLLLADELISGAPPDDHQSEEEDSQVDQLAQDLIRLINEKIEE